MFTVAIAVFLVLFDLFLLYLLWIGAPYIPTKKSGVEKILECCGIRPGMKAADIGSGDGRIVIALARAGAIAHGYEINPLLVWWSRVKIRQAGLDGRAFIHRKNLWSADFSSFDVVTVFGVFHIMRRLETKLRRELKPGARAVSIGFEFPTWLAAEKHDGIFVYLQPD